MPTNPSPRNPYQPTPMRVLRAYYESTDRSLKTLELSFENQADRVAFFQKFNPGQFCQLSVFGKGESPLGVASAAWEGDFVRFTIQRMGSVTKALHNLKPGDTLGMRGPLGNGFPLADWKGKNLVIIGGGCAFSTLYALTKHVQHPKNRPDFAQLVVIYGARSSGLCMYKHDIQSWYQRDDMEVHQAIDVPEETWDHHVGYVPDVVKQIAPSPVNAVAIVCGPPIMTKFTLPALVSLGFPPEAIYTSLEKRMKCGIGKCGRCNIGSKFICKDGPVFSLAELNALPADI
ncbi:MAG TPA: FAD/NAD(P)-binding protein [Anaerolineaceae bacterium]|nr:FAD/NAD(P)-binding protein [Anaerolineales bacterium]HOT52608.1 FAD/NAD(P)-binding protein [Anaerolineaceae bacterium]HQC20365.1 FAD/NAD(P)-binding protein [Anaerolineaceae bacterium]